MTAAVARITAQARGVEIGRVALAVCRLALTVFAAVLYALGYGTAKLFALVWFALAWSGTAIQVGWQDARSGSSG